MYLLEQEEDMLRMEMESANMLDSVHIDDDEDQLILEKALSIQGSVPGRMYMQSQVPSF